MKGIGKKAWLVAVLLLLGAGVRAWVSVPPQERPRKDFSSFPTQLGGWTQRGVYAMDDEVSGVLKADDTVNRRYADGKGPVDLFIAYYKIQRAGESMHSPKNCLPGSGWTPVVNDRVVMDAHGADGSPVYINRYVIEKGSERALVLYWYQASGRVIASEYWGKFYLVYDTFRSGRRDGALVRITLPLLRDSDQDDMTARGLEFARAVAAPLAPFLPN